MTNASYDKYPQKLPNIEDDCQNDEKESQKLHKKLNDSIEDDDYEEENYIIEDKVRVGNYEDAPSYLKDNEYIKKGYLLNCHSVKLVLRSLFVCSNETVNIWSHLLGAVLAVVLIFLTYKYVGPKIIKELSFEEFEYLKIQVNETVVPWSEELNKHKIIEMSNLQPELCSIIDNIIITTNNLITDYGNKYDIFSKILSFTTKINNYITSFLQIFIKKNNSNVYDDLTIKWDICLNKINDLINEDNNSIENNKEKIGRWPLFLMLVAAIICLGCSASFHWFGIYNKKVYKFLSRLDYAGISFLVPGSCYPPYYYFYYCEKCKKFLFLILILIYRDRKSIYSVSINFWIFSFCLYFNSEFSFAF